MATEPIPTEDRQVFFTALPDLRLVREGAQHEVSHSGVVRQIHPGLAYEFHGHHLVIDDGVRERDRAFFADHAEELGGLVDTRPAEEWLRTHDIFDSPRGFVELSPAAPASGPVLAAIAQAAAEGDIDAIVALHDGEEAGYKREDVLVTARNAIAALEAPAPAA